MLLFPIPIFAHQTSDSYLRIEKSQISHNAQIYVALNDLDGAIGIDRNRNGGINELEVNKQRERVINQYILSKLSIRQNNSYCSLRINAHQIQKFNFGVYLSVPSLIQ